MKKSLIFFAYCILQIVNLLSAQSSRMSKNIVAISADVQTEQIRVLADGNTLNQTLQGHFYRDTLGRTCFEQGQTKTITDFANHTVTVLDLAHRTAKNFIHGNASIPTRSSATRSEPARQTSPADVGKSQLGTREMQGVEVTGQRFVTTIPTRAFMGNSKPLQQTTEIWVSKDLQLPLETKVTTPLNGTVTTRYTNIHHHVSIDPREFEIPQGFQVVQTNLEPQIPAR